MWADQLKTLVFLHYPYYIEFFSVQDPISSFFSELLFFAIKTISWINFSETHIEWKIPENPTLFSDNSFYIMKYYWNAAYKD